MSIKIQVKNLNLTELGDGFSRELESVPVGTSVDELISRISTELNLPTTSRIEIFYRGEILKRTESLVTYVPESLPSIDFYLIQSNKQLPIKNDKPSAHEIYTLVNALGSLFRSRTRKNYLESLLREPNKLADVLAPLPEIKNDPVCFGFVQNYDLIKFMIDQKRAENMVQSNPNVYYALKLIADHVREFGKKSPIDEKFVSKRSYSIDDASEDEDQHHQAQQQQHPQPVVRSGPAISQDHFAAVLAMLNAQQQQRTSGSNQQQQQQQQNPAPVPAPAAAGSQPTLTPPIFDRNEFQSIMQQIMMSSTTTQSQPSQQQSQQPSSSSQQQTQQQPAVSNEMAAKLEQMHEFGFFDDAQNMRALEITEGNVEAAISLIIDGGDMI